MADKKLQEFLNITKPSDVAAVNVFAIQNGNDKLVKVKVAANGKNHSFETDTKANQPQNIIMSIINPLIEAGLSKMISVASPDADSFAMQESRVYKELPCDTVALLNAHIKKQLVAA